MGLIRVILNIYIIIIIVDAIVSYIPSLARQPLLQFNKKLADFSLKPVRRMLSPELPFDLSPLVVIIIIYMVKALW